MGGKVQHSRRPPPPLPPSSCARTSTAAMSAASVRRQRRIESDRTSCSCAPATTCRPTSSGVSSARPSSSSASESSSSSESSESPRNDAAACSSAAPCAVRRSDELYCLMIWPTGDGSSGRPKKGTERENVSAPGGSERAPVALCRAALPGRCALPGRAALVGRLPVREALVGLEALVGRDALVGRPPVPAACLAGLPGRPQVRAVRDVVVGRASWRSQSSATCRYSMCRVRAYSSRDWAVAG